MSEQITVEELRIICDATVRLTELRWRGCNHLCVENCAPEIMRKLLLTLQMHKDGFVSGRDKVHLMLDYEYL